MDNVAPILSPDKSLMVEHLGLLFGRAMEGRIEVTAIKAVPREERVAPRTQFFRVDQLDEAADWAAEVNADHLWNVYVGAALRQDDVFPGKAAEDEDFLKTYAVWADADNQAQVDAARAAYTDADLSPSFVVVTGRTPERRGQYWWTLETPISDIEAVRATVRGVADALGTDHGVLTGKQLMRLAGSLAWPKPNKPGRILERTELIRPDNAAREVQLERIHRAFPPVDRSQAGSVTVDVEIALTGALGLTEKIMDGREGYAFRLVRAHLRQWIGTTGCEPTADELYRDVAPVYLAKVDQVRPGRGPDFLKAKCMEALRAFSAGQIPGMRTLDEAVVTWAEKHRHDPKPEPDGEVAAATNPPVRSWNLTAWNANAYRGPAKPIEWLCDGAIPLGIPVLFASMGGLGKSFMGLDLGLEIAVGVVAAIRRRSILGGPVVQEGSAVILSGEDSRDSVHRRLEAIDPDGKRLLHPERLIVAPLPDMGGPRPLIASDGKSYVMTQAFHDLKAELMTIPDLRVVVIDPLQAFVSADINSDPAAGQFMWSAFAAICAATGATVICAHHMRKEGAASIKTADEAREAIRGSTALVDGARLTYALWKASGDDGRDVCARLNEDFAPERVAFGAVVKANDQANRDIQTYVRQSSGLLIDRTASVASSVAPKSVSVAQAQAIVAEIGKAWEAAREGRGEGYAMSPQSGERQAWKLIQRRTGCSTKDAKDLAMSWIENGILEMQTVDPKRHRGALRQVGRLG